MARKRGKLSNEEMNYIRQNCFDISIKEIADKLNRTIEPIKKFIDKENLKRRDLTDDEYLLHSLRDKYFYLEIREQLVDSELIFFEHQWIDFIKQFNEDVTHTEEMQIVEVIRTEILINRSMRDRKLIIEEINRLENEIEALMKLDEDDPEKALITTLHSQLGSLMGSKGAYINEHEKLVKKKEDYLKQLKGTREQRKRVADDAQSNFASLLRKLQEMDMREQEGFDMEVQSIAANKARKRLAEYHRFEDGEIDQPLLNSDTVIEEED